jgi:hypothetical protein
MRPNGGIQAIAHSYLEGTGGNGRVGGGPGQGGRFCVDMLASLEMMAIESCEKGLRSWSG